MGTTTGPNQIQAGSEQPTQSQLPDQLQDDTGNSATAAPLITGQPSTPQQVQTHVVVPGRSGAIDSTKNPQLHKFVNAVFSAISGSPTKQYRVGPDGTMTEVPQAPESRGSKIRRLIDTVGTGLEAGSRVPPQRSAAASIAAGLGAGFGAEGDKLTAADQAAQQKSKEEFERDQQMTLRKMDIGIANARNLGLYYDNVRKQNDLDPIRAQNKEIADAFRNIPGHSVTEMDAEAAAKAVADPNNQIWAHTHLILPAGMQPMTDDDGNPVKDAAGNFKSKGRVFVIDGTKDGKIPLPASVLSDIQKHKGYGDLAAIGEPLDHLEAGQEMEPQQFVSLYGKLLSAKTDIAKGWTNPDLSEDADGNVIQHNSVDATMTKPATESQTQKFRMDQAKLAETKSITAKNNAEAAKAKKATEADADSDLTGEDYLRSLPIAQQTIVRAVGEGRQALPANRKEALALLKQVHQAYTDFDETKVKTWQKANNEYRGSGKTAQSLVRANTAMAHAKALYDETTADAVLNPFSKSHNDREITLGLLKDEIGAAVKGGIVTEGEGNDLFDRLSGGLTVGAKRERIAEVTRRLHDRIEEQQTKFAEAAPSSAVKVPSLLSPQAAAAYDYVQSGGKTQAGSQSGQTQSVGHKVGDTIVQNGRTFTVTSVDANGKVTGAQ